MILYANGDSNTYGDELVPPHFVQRLPTENQANGATLHPDETAEEAAEIEAYRLQHAWPGVLGEYMNASRVINAGLRGGSNDRMFRTTLDWLSEHSSEIQTEGALIVIGTTGIARCEVFVEEGDERGWDQIAPTYGPPGAYKAYYRHLHSDESDLCRLWQGIVAVQNTCRVLGANCLFFSAYPDQLSGAAFLNPARLANLVERQRLIPENMWEHCSDTPSGPRYHYLTEGHRKWADLLYKYLPFS